MTKEDEEIATIYENARSESSKTLWAIHLQIKRLRSGRYEIAEFILQKSVDFHFLVTAFTRLRNLASLVEKNSNVTSAIKQFDEALPHLKTIRNVLEHIDAYHIGKGRKKEVRAKDLRVFILDNDKIQFLGYKIDLDQALKVSEDLFQSIKENAPEAYNQKVKNVKIKKQNCGGAD